ncbi:hypothetical protein R1sor_002575 [Riccia sorocarpa]|uniref:Ribosomal protein L1 n=1 Tax=Riccia sorocarpa TaxID=122646 RepID=A0ABD3GZJ7_9MARC
MGRIDEERVGKAVDALLKWSKSQKGRDRGQLLEDEQLLYVTVALKKIPEKSRTNPYMVPLPHPLFSLDGSQEICLFIKDGDKGGLKSKEAKAKVLEEGLGISKVIRVSKLKSDYFPHEAKRKLCGSYDLFLADDRVLPVLPKLLGKTFFKKKKHPIPVRLSGQQWKQQIRTACTSALFYVGGGSCSSIKVARISQSRDEIKTNVIAVMEGVASQVPKKWSNIQALYLKTQDSVALPLYQGLVLVLSEFRGREVLTSTREERQGKVK